MGNVIVIEFITLDGIVSDPDGSSGTSAGGWAFRHGPDTVAGDKFKLGTALDTGILLFGRSTWHLFSRLWPTRTDPFAEKMNAIPKLVASNTLTDLAAWTNSELLAGDLTERVDAQRARRDVIVIGGVSIARQLADNDRVDEYRLLISPQSSEQENHSSPPPADRVRRTRRCRDPRPLHARIPIELTDTNPNDTTKRNQIMARFLALYGTPTDPAAFERHYHEVHVPLARKLPGLRSYTISRNLTPVRGDNPYYLVAQLEWDDLDALRAAFQSAEGRAAAADVANLTNYATTVSMIYESEELHIDAQ